MTQRPSSTTLGALTVVLTLLGWASVPLFLRHFAEQIDAWTSNGWRYGFSALVWLPVLIVVWFRKRLPRGLWAAALAPSVVNAAGQVCFTWAHYRIEPGLLTFGLRSQLIFVAIGAYILFPKEREVIRTPGYLVGGIILIAGMAAVVLMDDGDRSANVRSAVLPNATVAFGPSRLDFSEHSNVLWRNDGTSSAALDARSQPVTPGGALWGGEGSHFQGVALAIFSGFLFACYGLAVRKYMHGINSVIAFAAICQYTAGAMVLLMLIFGRDAGATVLQMPGNQVIMLLASALIGIAIGHVSYYISIARLGVAVTAGVLQLQPFIVALASMALFKEVLSGWQWIGGCVAVIGAMLMLGVQWRMSKVAPSVEEPVAIAEGESGA